MKNIKILPLIPLFLLAGCSNSNNNTMYTDKASVTNGKISLSFTNLNEYKAYESEKCTVNFTLNLLSSNPKPVEYKISSPKVVRESNKAEYSASSIIVDYTTISLECDIAKTCSFSATLPSSINSEKYYFSFKGNGVTYKYCLYESPDELRTKYNVKYVIDGSEVGTKQIPEGKKLSSYDWVSSDYMFSCNEWYTDSSLTNKIADDFAITQNTTVYGKKTLILKYNTPENINAAYVSGYYIIPSNGEIVIPKTFAGKEVYGILAGSFRGEVEGLKKIYIPKISAISSVQNFSECKDLETVYFEGTQSEWNSINEATFKNSVNFVFNTYK